MASCVLLMFFIIIMHIMFTINHPLQQHVYENHGRYEWYDFHGLEEFNIIKNCIKWTYISTLLHHLDKAHHSQYSEKINMSYMENDPINIGQW